MNKLNDAIERTIDEINDARRDYIDNLQDVAKYIAKELKALETNPEAMPSTSSVGSLMCLSQVEATQIKANRMGSLNDTLRTLNYLARD